MAPLTLKLSKSEIKKINELTRKGVADARAIKRGNILNFLHQGLVSSMIIKLLDVDQKTVTNICNTYNEHGLERALYDDERPGRPLLFDDRDKANIIAMVCSDPPVGFARWTLELIQVEVEKREIVDSICKESVRIILQENELKPWQEKMWCIGELDEEYIRKMEDVLDVYEKEYDPRYPVVCVDEKPIQLLGEKREKIKATAPGEITKIDCEYVREGTANVFCAVEPLKGRYINKVTESRTGSEFAKLIRSISREYSTARKIILVMDNLNTHTEKSLTEYYGKDEGKKIWDRFEVHYTPKHGSWLDQAEIAIGMYSRQCLGTNRIPDINQLKKITKAWNKSINKKATVIQWKFTKEKAREKLKYSEKLNG